MHGRPGTGCDEDESEGFWDAYERYRGVEVTKADPSGHKLSHSGY